MNTWCGVIWQIACSVYASNVYELQLMSASSEQNSDLSAPVLMRVANSQQQKNAFFGY